MQQIPSLSQLKAYPSDEQLKLVLDEVNALCFPLLRWVVRSNRTHLAYIPPKRQIKGLNTDLQFQVVSSFPEHEQKFLQYKQQARNHHKGKGTYYAWHGSPMSNWHSIIRTGLRGGFVPGIYHAQNVAVSYAYMAVGSGPGGWPNSMRKTSKMMSCISMIEVADLRHNTSLITGGNAVDTGTVNVAMDHALVVTRFLFFYPKDAPASLATSTLLADTIPEANNHLFLERDKK